MTQYRAAALVAFVLISACGQGRLSLRKPASAKLVSTDWRKVAMRGDLTRLYGWRDAFVKGLNAATLGGSAAKVVGEGALLQPDSALETSDLPAGRYRCRTIKLGGTTGFATYPAFDCVVGNEGDVASLAKLSGSQRPVGLVFDHDRRRKIFLGTLMLGDERTAIEYGRDPDRDMAGAIERIGPARWRLVLPYPRFESVVDIVELVPVS